VLEHLFVGDLLRALWRRGRRDIEVLRAEVDAGGYDLAFECNGVLRHVQLKASHRQAIKAAVPINTKLAEKPGGCIVWITFDQDTLELGPFLWFGGRPGERLPDLGSRLGRQNRANSLGVKGVRAGIRVLSKHQFTKLHAVDEVVEALFGIPAGDAISAQCDLAAGA
jgi:hypothetical protein